MTLKKRIKWQKDVLIIFSFGCLIYAHPTEMHRALTEHKFSPETIGANLLR